MNTYPVHQSPSPNQRPMAAGVKPRLIVIHGTAGSDKGDLDWIRDKAPKPAREGGGFYDTSVSYNDLIWRDGTVHVVVPAGAVSWHAGVSYWQGSSVNAFSIGIGVSNRGPWLPGHEEQEPYTDAQYESCGIRVAQHCQEFNIDFANVVGHYHVSPGRKMDPGLHFNWGAMFGYARQALHELGCTP